MELSPSSPSTSSSPSHSTFGDPRAFLKALIRRFFPLFPDGNSAIYRNPVYHQVVFATLMVITSLRILYLIHSDTSDDIPPVVKKRIGKIYQTGLLTFLAGFAIWNLDNIYCSTLTAWKTAIGWPVAFLLEGTDGF
jgi:dihydroceramidase